MAIGCDCILRERNSGKGDTHRGFDARGHCRRVVSKLLGTKRVRGYDGVVLTIYYYTIPS